MIPVPPRSRLLYLLLAAATVATGLATRRFGDVMPTVVAKYTGDVLWASMVYLGIGAAWNRASNGRVAVAAGAFSLAIELGQLYHAPWIDGIRGTRLGGLVLGFGFLWSDLLCYGIGIALAAALDHALAGHRRPDAVLTDG